MFTHNITKWKKDQRCRWQKWAKNVTCKQGLKREVFAISFENRCAALMHYFQSWVNGCIWKLRSLLLRNLFQRSRNILHHWFHESRYWLPNFGFHFTSQVTKSICRFTEQVANPFSGVAFPLAECEYIHIFTVNKSSSLTLTLCPPWRV